MNRNDFIRAIEDTSSIGTGMIGEITEVLEMFPYFQSAHLLLLKSLYDNSDIKFESQLRFSALHASDREKLYYLLQRKKPADEPVRQPEIVAEEADSAIDNFQVVIEEGKNSQEIIAEIEKEEPLREDGKNSDFNMTGIPRSLLVTDDSQNDESVNMIFLLDDDEEKMPERIIYADPSIMVPRQEDLLELDTSAEAASDEQPVVPPAKPESSTLHLQEQRPETEQDKEKDTVILSKKQAQADLIDKFIIANPRIEPVREKTDHPAEDKSKPFTEEKGGFVTETLAKIYINQGYYSKAIDIYEKLCLKFPEKSSYFAGQIEKIKEFIKY